MRIYTETVNYYCKLHHSYRSFPVLLMLHGFMGSGRVFEPLIPKMSTFCNPLTIDLAGHGKTLTPCDPALFSAERQSEQILSLLNRLHLKPLYIYGYSMGGRLAFQLMARYPELFAGVIIESAHCGIADESERKNRTKTDEERAAAIESDFDEFLNNWNSLPLFDHTSKEMKDLYHHFAESQNPELMAASLRGFGAGNMPPVCEQIKKSQLPVKLIAGSKDKTYVSIMEKISASCSFCTLDTVHDAGHRVHADKPEEWLRIIRKFLDMNILR